MRSASALPVILVLAACAGPYTNQDTAIRDFIAVSSLQEAERVETASRDGQELISDRFLLYKTRRGNYLIEFSRPCRDIRDQRIVADTRWDARYIRPRVDTLNGCQIGRIYALTEGQSSELEELGEAPGDRL